MQALSSGHIRWCR